MGEDARRLLGVAVCVLFFTVGCTRHTPLTVSMTVEPSSGYAPLSVRLEAVAMPDADDHFFSWTFDDGTTAEGRVVEHVLVGKGEMPVRLTATAADGLTASADGAIMLLNRLPEARFTYQPQLPPVHLPIHFDASNSFDPDGGIVSYHWDFGDGGTAEGVKVSHAFEVPQCEYRVVLTVTDDSGDSNQAYRLIEPFGCDH